MVASKLISVNDSAEKPRIQQKEFQKFEKAFKKYIKKSKAISSKVTVLLLPINISNMHWLSIKVDLKNKSILIFDSLKSCSAGIEEILENLKPGLDAYTNSEGIHTESEDWSIINCKVDQQKNSYDCGVLALKFMETILMGEDASKINARNAQYFRYQIGLRLLKRLMPK